VRGNRCDFTGRMGFTFVQQEIKRASLDPSTSNAGVSRYLRWFSTMLRRADSSRPRVGRERQSCDFEGGTRPWRGFQGGQCFLAMWCGINERGDADDSAKLAFC